MHAMVLEVPGTALEWTDLADRQPGPGEIRVKVAACGVCRTDLHVVDGELPDPHLGSAPHGSGTPDRIRTCYPRLRRPVLYPNELRARNSK